MPRKKKPIKDDPQSELFEVSAEVESSSYSKASDDDLFDIKTDAGHVDDMFSDWFLDYASYVILERAVPHANDGLKPVQRRILHSMRELEDGRYNKVANLIGNTMKYHPHGDASIADAMVQLGQKDFLVDMQGNWGNTLTGDSAAAPRYIEARLSKFALEVVFNSKTTNWLSSYDGRNKEPETLPIKFPLLLAQGAEGIAVGLSCKILPHNFNELLDGCIALLRKEKPEIVPDFPTGGFADVTDYNNGKRGGRVRVRARIEVRSKLLLAITELPFGKTTTSLIESIISANEKGKIKIARVEDNTADIVEILVYLSSGSDPHTVEQALYAFTDCELSVSTNICVIENDRPHFFSAQDLLYLATEKTRNLLKLELEIHLRELDEKWHFSSLEKIFIEKRIYRRIEEEETWDAVIATVDKGLKPYKKTFKRDITRDDITRLLEIKIKRISKYDTLKADELIRGLEDEIKVTKKNLKSLTKYTIKWFTELKKNFGKGRERKTVLTSFQKVVAQDVVIANQTLYVNRREGFAGIGMKKDEAICKCSSLDDVIAINQAGKLTVSKVSEKAFFGKDILYVNIFNRSEPDVLTYCMVYRDGKSGPTLAKHFTIGGMTRDKEYDLTKGKPGSRVYYISCYSTATGRPDSVKVNLKPAPRLRKAEQEVLFKDYAVRGRSSGGNIITKKSVRNVVRMTKAAREEADLKDSD
ncbi:MAG: DNA gyrase/topoisomerase IV subunit A [Verrucomicrobiota bacterium]|nr:DNA gyrase/topoisomerase IV subunit A [Verrucomicrobiota bacterium]